MSPQESHGQAAGNFDPEAEQEIDFSRFWRVLASRWWLLVGGLVVGAIVGYAVSLGSGQVYKATATLYLGQPYSASGNIALQTLQTNPSTVRAIATSSAVVGARRPAVQDEAEHVPRRHLHAADLGEPVEERPEPARLAHRAVVEAAGGDVHGERARPRRRRPHLGVREREDRAVPRADHRGRARDRLAQGRDREPERRHHRQAAAPDAAERAPDGSEQRLAAARPGDAGRGAEGADARVGAARDRAQPPQLGRRRSADRAAPRRARRARVGPLRDTRSRGSRRG